MSLPAGYVSRPATWDDLDAVVELFKACDRIDAGFEDPVREHLEDDWRRSGYDLDRHTRLGVAGDGMLVAFAEVFGLNPELSIETWVRVHPAHRGRGLGDSLLAWTEGRARELVSDGVTSKLHNAVPATDELARSLLAEHGYEQVRTFWHMERDLSSAIEEAVAPEGTTVRAYRHETDLEAVYDVLEEAFADHWNHEPYPRDEHDEEMGRADPALVGVALEGEQVVGALIGRTVEGVGWVDVLGVRPGARGRGIGRSLLLRSFAALAERGPRSVMLNVDSTNATGATRLYESVGLRVRRAWHVFEKPVPTDVSWAAPTREAPQ